jgi:hypothetical protein
MAETELVQEVAEIIAGGIVDRITCGAMARAVIAHLEGKWADWSPTVERVNALPGPVRRYVHDLETRCDPSGEVAELIVLRERLDQLLAQHDRTVQALVVSALRREVAELKARLGCEAQQALARRDSEWTARVAGAVEVLDSIGHLKSGEWEGAKKAVRIQHALALLRAEAAAHPCPRCAKWEEQRRRLRERLNTGRSNSKAIADALAILGEEAT